MSPRARQRPAPGPAFPRRFLALLHQLGWSLGPLESPEPLHIGRSRVPRGAWQAIPLPDGQLALLVHLAEPLPQLDDAFAAYEDLTPLHAELRAALAHNNLVHRHVVLLDDALNAQILDLEMEDILLDVRGEEEFAERLLPLLNLAALARGSLATFPRKTRSQRARELADWTRHWTTRLGAAAGTTPPHAFHFVAWLHLARLAERLGLMPPAVPSFAVYTDSPRAPQPARFVERLFRPLSEGWNFLQGAPLETQRRIAEAAHAVGELAPCLASYARLSRAKFSSEVFGEAFSDEELRLVGWRQSLVEQVERRDEGEDWLEEPAHVDLDRAGMPGLLRQYDEVTEALRDVARRQAVARERGQRPGLQADLFAPTPPDLDEEDVPRVAMQFAIRVRTVRKDRAETARLVLLARCAEWHARLRRPDPLFTTPRVETTETPAPAPDALQPRRHPELN